MWVSVSVAAILYAVIGIYQGLAQQGLVGRPAAVVCEYRFDLVRDRLIAMFDQRPALWTEHDVRAATDTPHGSFEPIHHGPSGPEFLHGPSGPESLHGSLEPEPLHGSLEPELATLFRETFALCAGSDPVFRRRLDRMFALYSEFAERSQRHADARRELLAL